MKHIIIALIIILISGIFVNPAGAIEVKSRNEYLFDVRGDDGDIALTRLSVGETLEPYQIEASLFSEAQWNVDISDWEKLLLGIEAGKLFWKHLYVSQSLQFISGQFLDHMVFATNGHSFDTITKLRFTWPFMDCFSLGLFEEYAFNLEEGSEESNEIGAEVIYNFKDSYEVGVGWRHTDRIHNFDSDYVSLSFSLSF